jgi:hypothetical protein
VAPASRSRATTPTRESFSTRGPKGRYQRRRRRSSIGSPVGGAARAFPGRTSAAPLAGRGCGLGGKGSSGADQAAENPGFRFGTAISSGAGGGSGAVCRRVGRPTRLALTRTDRAGVSFGVSRPLVCGTKDVPFGRGPSPGGQVPCWLGRAPSLVSRVVPGSRPSLLPTGRARP